MPLKREDTVDPISTLVIRPYDVEYLINLAHLRFPKPAPIEFHVVENLKGKTYRLTGIVMARNGHYTTIAYVPEKEQWYNFNVEKVHPVDQPVWNNLAGDSNVPVLFFYTLQEDQKNSKKRKWNHDEDP